MEKFGMMGDMLICLKMNEFSQKTVSWIGGYKLDYKTTQKTIDSILDLQACWRCFWLFALGSCSGYSSSDCWRFIGYCMLDFIHPIAQEKLHQQVQHLAPCRLRFGFLAAIPSVEQECEKAISQIDIKLTSVAYSFMMEILILS